MFDVAPTELLLVAVIALLVIGPKDLPKAMRFVGHWVGKARGMARHFRSGIDTMMREAELEEMEAKWRAHNDAIMKAYPDITTTPPTATGDAGTGDALADAAGTGPHMLPGPMIGPPAPGAAAPAADAAADVAAATAVPGQRA